MEKFDAGQGYLATPASGTEPGILVLHAWWGLNDFFKATCDKLAQEGFIAFAPDLFGGKTAATIDEAQALVSNRDDAAMTATANGALEFLRGRCDGAAVGVIGFSLGAPYALELSAKFPDAVAAVTLFYGCGEADFSASRAAFLGHFSETDAYEPIAYVREMETAMRAAGRDFTLEIYPNAAHWFAETDRPEYDAEASELAWRRTFDFLRAHLAVA